MPTRLAKYSELPDLSNYYTKEEVNNLIEESSPIKKMTIEKTCSVRLQSSNSNNAVSGTHRWYSEYSDLNPISMSIKYKTINIRPDRTNYPGITVNLFYPGLDNYDREIYQVFKIDPSLSESPYIEEITELPDLSVTQNNSTIFSVNMQQDYVSTNEYISGSITVTVDLTILYI